MKKIIVILISLFILCGCSGVIYDSSENVDTTNLSFNSEDMDSSYSNTTNLVVDDDDVYITNGGTYTLSGVLEDVSVIIEVDEKEEVQLVLDNVTINSNDFAAIYIIEADKVTITLAEGSVNTLSDSTTYKQIDTNDVDAVIFSKADLVINGEGTLNINANYKHSIVSKDDLIITGGNYNITAAGQGICGKDCLKISSGNFNVESGGDALKSNNDEDADRGYVYITGGNFVINSQGEGIYGINLVSIEGGNFNITTSKSSNTSYKAIKSDASVKISAGEFIINAYDDGIHSDNSVYISGGDFTIVSTDDGIHGDGLITIDDGNINISAREGIEGTYIVINGGTINISASDDGINAGQKISSYTPTVEINGGYITIVMGQGDTDGIDSNGYIYINGGTVDITGQSAFDYDLGAEHNGGTIIVNGSQTDTITNQFGGGMQGAPGQGSYSPFSGFGPRR